MLYQCLRKIKGKWLSFCKYNKQRIMRSPRYLLTQRVRSFLENGRDLNMSVDEAEKIRKFLRWNLVGVFNDPFVHSYDFRVYNVLRDQKKDLWFVYTSEGKKLYFKRGMSRKEVIRTYRFLEKEQDLHSPHYYFFDGLTVSENSIVADIGVAEGNFGLKIVDRVKELYLFECDPGWIEALEATFDPWKDKVHIVNCFVSDMTSSDTVRLDDFFKDKNVPHILKLDVEGAEAAVLEGASAFLKEGHISDLLVCTYHKKGDPEKLSAILKDFGYTIAFSPGYMLFLKGDYKVCPPYDFRKGLLHGERNLTDKLLSPTICRNNK